MLNTLFDLLNYHINRTEYDLITFVTNNENRIKSLLNHLIDISELNNLIFLYLKFDEENNNINCNRFIFDNLNYLTEIEDKILELKNEIKFVVIDNFDLIKCHDIKFEYNYEFRAHLSNHLKIISMYFKLPIIVLKKDNLKEKDKYHIITLLEELGQDSDLIIYENNENELKVLKNRYGVRFELIDY